MHVSSLQTSIGSYFRRQFFRAWVPVLAVLFLGVCPAGASDPGPGPRDDSAEALEYLPTLLSKALFENQRESVNTLRGYHQIAKTILEGGDASPASFNRVERVLLQARVLLVERETKYLNSLDRFHLKSRTTAERLKKIEDEVLLPVRRQWRKWEDVLADFSAVMEEFKKAGDRVPAARLRPLVRRLTTSSDLVKGTRFARDVSACWDAWEKLSADDLRQEISRALADRRKLRERQSELELQGKTLPEADLSRLKELGWKSSLGALEQNLRRYKDNGTFPRRTVATTFESLLLQARNDRLHQIQQSWPVPPGRLKGINVLTGDLKAIEKELAPRLRMPGAVVEVRGKIRELRALGQSYMLQRQLFEVARAELESAVEQKSWPPELEPICRAVQMVSEARDELLRTWISYHVVRLELLRLQ